MSKIRLLPLEFALASIIRVAYFKQPETGTRLSA